MGSKLAIPCMCCMRLSQPQPAYRLVVLWLLLLSLGAALQVTRALARRVPGLIGVKGEGLPDSSMVVYYQFNSLICLQRPLLVWRPKSIVGWVRHSTRPATCMQRRGEEKPRDRARGTWPGSGWLGTARAA